VALSIIDDIISAVVYLSSCFSVEETDAYNTKQSCVIFAGRFLVPEA
jgi:hypothetical protein